jgi:hypothetical protein
MKHIDITFKKVPSSEKMEALIALLIECDANFHIYYSKDAAPWSRLDLKMKEVVHESREDGFKDE